MDAVAVGVGGRVGDDARCDSRGVVGRGLERGLGGDAPRNTYRRGAEWGADVWRVQLEMGVRWGRQV